MAWHAAIATFEAIVSLATRRLCRGTWTRLIHLHMLVLPYGVDHDRGKERLMINQSCKEESAPDVWG